MFWSFCFANGYFPTNLLPLFYSPTLDQNPTLQASSPFQKSQNILLDLTAQDHLSAGYQNKKKLWNEEQDEKLKHLRQKELLEWDQIASELPGRNAKMCYSRYKRLEFQSRDQWKRTEDELLLRLLEEHGENWDEISKHFEKRSLKQIKEHYSNYLRPNINKEDWTLQQDVQLTNLLNKYGKNWKVIEQIMEGRTQNQIKNRFFGRLRKIQQKKSSLVHKEAPGTSTSI